MPRFEDFAAVITTEIVHDPKNEACFGSLVFSTAVTGHNLTHSAASQHNGEAGYYRVEYGPLRLTRNARDAEVFQGSRENLPAECRWSEKKYFNHSTTGMKQRTARPVDNQAANRARGGRHCHRQKSHTQPDCKAVHQLRP